MSDTQTKLTLRVVAPTISGPLPVAVDGVVHGAPRGSRVAHADGALAAYVLAPDGRVHMLTGDGEVLLDRSLQQGVKRRYFSA